MIDERTPAYHLPLPHPNNRLVDDVVRIRDAIQEIDAVLSVHRAAAAESDVLFAAQLRRERLRRFHEMGF